MKIRNIRTYQAVQLGSKTETFFSSEKTPNKLIYTLELVEHVGIQVSGDKDSAVIPFANISAIRLLTDANESEMKQKKLDAVKYEETRTVAKLKKHL